MITQVEIARRLGLDVSSVNKILNRRSGPVFKKETIKKVFKTARQMGYDFGRIKFVHRRKHSRREVNFPAEFSLFNKEGALYDKGTATIRDISLGGAQIVDVTLPLGSFPVDPFWVSIKPLAKSAGDLEIVGQIVRLDMNDTATYGVSFKKLDDACLQRLRRIAG